MDVVRAHRSEEIAMWIQSPEALYSWAVERQRELIAEADRQRLLRSVARARRGARSAPRRFGRASPRRRAAVA
jgi:hypothetical protein